MRRRSGSLLRAWCAFWLWLACCCLGGAALAADEPVSAVPPLVTPGSETELFLGGRSLYWIDESASLTHDQVEATVQEIPWRLRRRENQRAPAGNLWIQFEAAVPPGHQWYLELASSVNDHVALFYRDRNGRWVEQQAGSGVPVSRWALPGRLPTFALAADDPRPVRYWLRVDDSHGDFVAPLALVRDDVLHVHRETEGFVLGAFFGLMALVALAAFSNGLAFRDKASILLGVYVLLMGIGQLGRSGLGGQHLWPESAAWNDAVLELWPGTAVAAGLWLVKVLTDPARLSPILDLAVGALSLALLAASALLLVVDTWPALALVLSLTVLAMVAVLAMVLWGWMAREERYLMWLALAFVPFVVLAMFPVARALGLAPQNLLTSFGLYLGTLLELPLLYYAVNTRLMARREAELRASALSRADPLTGLPHRQALIERLGSSLSHARSQRQSCALLCIRLSNLDAIGEDFGRDAADKALVVAASHLRRLALNYDMAARLGPREFALLMEAPATRDAAISRAQQVVASGLREVPALPGATLRFHIALAMLPRPQLDGAATLQWIMDGLEQITPETRKAIRSLDVNSDSALGERTS